MIRRWLCRKFGHSGSMYFIWAAEVDEITRTAFFYHRCTHCGYTAVTHNP